jgi:phosphoglycolate phosphatase-like HAD superfamily hydrolase
MMGLLLRRLGLAPEEVAYVGDTGADEGMCCGSGVRLIAFRNRKLKAWAYVEDFLEIPHLLGLK